jgi:zinc protease
MNIIRVRAAHLMAVFCLCAALAGAGWAGVEEFTVNGLKVILKPNGANDIISAQLYLRGGAMNLDDADQGIESLIFECAAKGTQRFPREALNIIMDKTAADIGSAASRNYTVVTLRCLRTDFSRVWDVYADVVMHPSFDPQDVEVVRQNHLLQLKQRRDNPDGYLNDLASEALYAGHPYRLDPFGIESTIANISIDQMKKYLADHLQTSRLLLVVVGNVTREDLQKKVAATFGTLPKGSYEPQRPGPVVHAAPSLKVVERQMPTNYISGRFAGPGPGDPDYVPMTVAMNILATRVWEEVRTKRNLSYAPGAGFSNQFANYGQLYVTAVQPDTTIKVMLAEVKKLQQTPVSVGDLHDRITMFLTGYNLQNETNAAQAQFLAFHELSGQGWQAGDKFIERVRSVTAEDVLRVANKYIRNIQFVILGNPKLIDARTFTPRES